MRLVTAAEMRELDRRTTTENGIPGAALMRRAGLGVAELVRRIARASGDADLPVLIAAGPGNNGGDGFAAAVALRAWGFAVQVRLAAEPERIRGEARIFLDALPAGLAEPWLQAEAWDADMPEFLPRGTVFVDALLGTGAAGAPRGAVAAAIRWLRRAAGVGRIVAVDLPSGLDADTGRCQEPHVVADATACLALPKTGLRSAAARDACGRVEIVPIGFPETLRGGEESGGWGWIAEEELRLLLPVRPRDAHKGRFGHVLVAGGSRGYSGAAVLAASAAVHSGAGLVAVLTPRCAAGAVAASVPEAMVWPCGSEASPALAPGDLGPEEERLAASSEALVLGPGLSLRPGAAAAVDRLLGLAQGAVVLDADALNAFAGRAGDLRLVRARLLLTPHPGEAGRLLGCSAADVQADRCAALRRLVEQTGATVILKGAGTLVGSPGRGVHQILAGNPGMATGGSGDVLAGLTGGLLAQGLAPFDAARLAVWWHAAAGDLAAWRHTEATLAAGDLLACLGTAYGWISPR